MLSLAELGPCFEAVYDVFLPHLEAVQLTAGPIPSTREEWLERKTFFMPIEDWSHLERVATELLRKGRITYAEACALVSLDQCV